MAWVLTSHRGYRHPLSLSCKTGSLGSNWKALEVVHVRDGGNMDQRRGSGDGEKAGFRELWKDLRVPDVRAVISSSQPCTYGTPDLNPIQLIVTEFSITAPEQSLVLEANMFILIVMLR